MLDEFVIYCINHLLTQWPCLSSNVKTGYYKQKSPEENTVYYMFPGRPLLRLIPWYSICKSIHCNSSEDRIAVCSIFGHPVFKWVVGTELTWDYQERGPNNDCRATCPLRTGWTPLWSWLLITYLTFAGPNRVYPISNCAVKLVTYSLLDIHFEEWVTE